jgi:hypothetical protein
MAILKTALFAAALASPLAAPVMDWISEPAAPAAQQSPHAQTYVPPPIDLIKLGQAFRH